MAWIKQGFLFLGCALAAACEPRDAPTKQLSESEAAVRAATELGAKGTPDAALHLQMANERLEKAKALDQRGDSESAKRLLEEAKADAELAVVLTRKEQAESDARNARQKLESAAKSAGPAKSAEPKTSEAASSDPSP